MEHKLCKLCYSSDKKIINIFDENGIELNMAQILRKHFWFKVIENDCVSNGVCTDCWWKTENFHKFYNDVKNAHINYTNILYKTNKLFHFKTKSIVRENSIKNHNECNGDIKFIKIESVDDDSDGIIANQILCDTIINQNSTEEMAAAIKNENCKGNHSSDIRESNDDEINISKRSKRKANKFNLTKTSKIVKTQNNVIKQVTSISKNLKNENHCEAIALEKKLQIAKEDAQIREYFKMECEICNYKFVTYLDAKAHYREQHKIKGFIICCKRKFFRRGAALEHIVQHINPEAYKCHFCNRIYANKLSLRNHIRDKHDSSDDKSYKCSVCHISYFKKSLLTQHIKYKHYTKKNKKFACDICGKSYLTKCHLIAHIRSIHENAIEHICDICGRVCQTISVFKRHRNTHFKGDASQKQQCNICGARLHKYSLGAHLARHRDTKHNCPQCGKESANKHALYKHIKCVHSGKLYVCKLCNKEFKEAIGLKEHLASHTGEILYTCPHCPKTFTHSSNMHSHRKKAHPIEWLENRRIRVAELPNL